MDNVLQRHCKTRPYFVYAPASYRECTGCRASFPRFPFIHIKYVHVSRNICACPLYSIVCCIPLSLLDSIWIYSKTCISINNFIFFFFLLFILHNFEMSIFHDLADCHINISVCSKHTTLNIENILSFYRLLLYFIFD